MSDTGETVKTRSAAAIRQDIAEYVLSHADEMSEVPGVKAFVEEHGRLTSEIAEGEGRLERLAKAKAEYEPLEQCVTSCRKTLKDAETELAKLHHPLGMTAFQVFLAGDLEDQPLFADRLAAHKRIQELQKERADLTPGSDAGMARKAQAKVQQMVVAGKIKMGETKVGGLEKGIGRKVIEDKLDESVRCDTTANLLDRIKIQRVGIDKFSEELKGAEIEQAETAKKLSATVGLADFGSSKELDAANNLCVKSVKQHNSDLDVAIRALADALREVDPSALPNELKSLRDSLANATRPQMKGVIRLANAAVSQMKDAINMAKIKPCKSCGKDVAKSAKNCPHCGQKLKMGLMMKAFLGSVGLIVILMIMRPSEEEQAAKAQKQIAEIESATASDLTSSELAGIFSMFSRFTDVQRENKEKEITGQIVEWSLPIYDVTKTGDGYKVQTKSTDWAVGTFLQVLPRNDDERSQIESLTEDDQIQIKGKITGTSMRNIKIDPAVLVQ
jgi:uncharacterized protein (UPF0212 family)